MRLVWPANNKLIQRWNTEGYFKCFHWFSWSLLQPSNICSWAGS